MTILWDPTSFLVGCVVLLLATLWWLSTRRPPGAPPGPGFALPLLGHLHLIGRDPRPRFESWKRQYGDVFSLYMGTRLVIVLASYSAIREALVTLADVFTDRPEVFISTHFYKDKGIVFAKGPVWKEQRKTSLEILRSMGMGKNVLAEKIQEEITHYIRAIQGHQGAPVDLARMTQVSVSNNICSIVFGSRFEYDDPEFIGYLETLDQNLQLLRGSSVLNLFPLLSKLPGDLFKGQRLLANYRHIYTFIERKLTLHQQTKDQERDSTDFLYSYLHQIDRAKTQGNVESSLSVEHLHRTAGNLFSAGTETTSTAIRWALAFFLHHPDVQDRCYREVSDVIGPHRHPTMADRPKMTYLDATICEVLRKADVVPLSLWHTANRDVTFRGYVIPQGVMIFPTLSCILGDPEIWGDPENFRPERFIGPDGKLTKPEEFIPFGAGRRVCLGESLARMELFLYLTTLVQHFRFLSPEGEELPSLEGDFGVTNTPKPYKIRAVPRM